MFKIYSLLIISSILINCGGGDSSNNENNESAVHANLILRDKFNQEASTFIQGEEIDFYLTSNNTTNEPITLTFSDSQQYEFYITSASGGEVWRWSADKVFAQINSQLILPAQGTIEASEDWDQILLVGGSIPIGSYIAFGSFKDQSSIAQFRFVVQ